MNKLIVLIAVGILATPWFLASQSQKRSFALDEVLPSGDCNLEIMKIAPSKRGAELETKIQKAVAKRRDWFLDYVKETKPGEPMAYHKNLGVTRDEYHEYLREAKQRKLSSTGEFLPCKFIHDGKILRLDVGSDTSALSKIRLDLSDNRLRASTGDIGLPEWDSNDRQDIPIGPWEGYIWRFEASSVDQFKIRIVALSIYRLRNSGKILWHFKDSEMVNKELKQNVDLLLQHSPKRN